MDDPVTNALALRVHPAIDLPAGGGRQARAAESTNRPAHALRWRRGGSSSELAGDHTDALDPELPTFVDRDIGPDLRQWLRTKRSGGGFLLLVGDSSVGKTRLLYEATRQELGDFAVLVPDLGDGELVNTIAEATFGLPKLIVWLDELQRFLDGPYLTPGSAPITPAAVRRLLDAPTPVVIVGTLWPQYATQLRATQPDPATGEHRPQHPQAFDIFDDRRLHEVAVRGFSRDERKAAAQAAARDLRLAEALADRDYNVTEVLAGARELVHRYERATDEQKAVLHSAIDSRRLGVQAPLSEGLLCTAARGYLTTVRTDDTWFAPALAELTHSDRPHDRATAPLIAILNAERSEVLGYTVADYLLQRLIRQRRSERLPVATWQALTEHPHDRNDLGRLADSAYFRMQYRYAEPIYQRLAHTGSVYAASRLVDLLTEQGRVNEAIETLRPHADIGGMYAADQLPRLLAKHGRIDELRSRANTGDRSASIHLAYLLAQQGHIDEAVETLRTRADADEPLAAFVLPRLLAEHGHIDEGIEIRRARADAGDWSAAYHLADLLAEHGRIDELRSRADAGDRFASVRLAYLLAEWGRVGEAIEILRVRAGSGDQFAGIRLADMLAEQGRIDEAIEALQSRADAGDRSASVRLAYLLAEWGRVDEAIETLRVLADIGDESAPLQLARLLAEQGRVDEAIETLRVPAGTGDRSAADQLANLLAEQGRVDELRSRADAGDWSAAHQLANLLATEGRADDLWTEMNAGIPGAAERLTTLLTDGGEIELADRMRQFGLNPDASVANGVPDRARS